MNDTFHLNVLAELNELAEAFHEDYRDATLEEMQEAMFNILETMTPAEADFWLDELEALEIEDPANYIPEDYLSEFLAEYEPEMFNDSAEFAEVLRDVFQENYQDAAPEEVEEALFDILEVMMPAEGINFTSAVRQVGQVGQKVLQDPTTSQIAKTVLPAAGATIGTVYGGPAGAVAGGKLGQAAGQAFSGGKKPSSPSAPSKTAQASSQGGSAAAAQLLQLLHLIQKNPDMLNKLQTLAVGSNGKKSAPVGKGEPEVGPLMNLFSTLANKAASDADELLWESEESAYLLDSEGDFLGDPTVPEERAQALYKALFAAENQGLIGETTPRQPWSSYLPFAKGAKLLVEYETWIRDFDIGNGNILERTPDLLKAKIHIDKWDRFNVPETYAMLMIEYKQDGPGNKAVAVVNDIKYTDNNVTIHSRQNTREILMSIKFLGQNVDRISLTRENSNKAKLKFNAGGDQHVLVLTRD